MWNEERYFTDSPFLVMENNWNWMKIISTSPPKTCLSFALKKPNMEDSKTDVKKITVTHEVPSTPAPTEPEPETNGMNASFSWTNEFCVKLEGEKLPREFLIMWILTLIVVIFGIIMKNLF